MLHKYLHSWDVISTELRLNGQREAYKNDLSRLSAFSKKFDWYLDRDQIVMNNYDALVLTDTRQTILWVNEGFEKMTGYDSAEVLGRRPGFLQGPETTETAKAKLRNGINEEKHARATLVNYRKTGETYQCQISILPLKNSSRHTTHFLAIERELK